MIVGVVAIRIWFLRAEAVYGTASEHQPHELTNCPDCGARTPAVQHDCEYCGEPLPTEGPERPPARSGQSTPRDSSDLPLDRRK